jgi:formate-dependent phosphoribosylglycinamide formyltransferase (GAR transformylase)
VNVVFVEPSFPDNQKEFVRGLAEVGATVIGIGERPKDWLDDDLGHWLTHYEQVPSVVDFGAMVETVRAVQRMVFVDRLETTVEAHVMTAAEVREATGIPGTSVRTAFLCRDKPAMKEALRAAGVPCARSTAAASGAEVRAFASEVGFPLIIKPPSGAGASGAHRVDSIDELDEAIARTHADQGVAVAVEEFVEGHEGFYDTITIGGRVVHDFATHYYPNVLEAMRTRWISPQLVTTNRIEEAPAYAEVRAMGQKVVEALGIETSATHMEWFAGPKGLMFSEIGCRPPGVRCWDLYAAANEFDIYREWAMAVVRGEPAQPLSRRFAAGMIALRPDRDGQIAGYDGVDIMQHRYGEWIIDAYLPPPGTPTQPVEAGYMANAWVRMRHPDYDELRRMLDEVGETIQVRTA